MITLTPLFSSSFKVFSRLNIYYTTTLGSFSISAVLEKPQGSIQELVCWDHNDRHVVLRIADGGVAGDFSSAIFCLKVTFVI